jgi:hypothetical protein
MGVERIRFNKRKRDAVFIASWFIVGRGCGYVKARAANRSALTF